MSETIHFDLVSPEALLLSESYDMVVMPGAEGRFGVCARHEALISTLQPGVIDIHSGGQIVRQIFVAGGFAEVTATKCTVLAEEAVPVEELVIEQIEQGLKNLGEDLAAAKDDAARVRLSAEIALAEARLAAARGAVSAH